MNSIERVWPRTWNGVKPGGLSSQDRFRRIKFSPLHNVLFKSTTECRHAEQFFFCQLPLYFFKYNFTHFCGQDLLREMEVVENLGFEVAGGSKESLAGNWVKCCANRDNRDKKRHQPLPNSQLSQVIIVAQWAQ